MDYKDWIKEARSKWGKSQEALATALGLTKGNVSAWENGRHKPRLEQIYAISRITGHQLPADVASIAAPHATAEPEGICVPLLANSASMGGGDELLENDVLLGTITLAQQFVTAKIRPTRIEALRFIHAYGDSMEPTFSSGDILLVDSGVREVKIDGIYVLSAHARLFVKRVRQRIDGKFEISSDNPTHKTVDVLNGDHNVQVIGRVLWVWGGHKL